MRYSDEVIEEIRLGNDIVDVISRYTTLKNKGNSYFGLCPFHKESTPSFSVSASKQLYHCFGCGASGTVFNFIMNIENYDFLEALKFLADRINYSLPEPNYSKNNHIENTLKSKLYEIHKLVARKYYDNLSTIEGDIATNYLAQRKIVPNIRKKYGIGYSLLKNNDIYKFLLEKGYLEEEILESGLVLKSKLGKFYDRFTGRLMFPIIDVQGRIIGFGGRELHNQKNMPKYLNSPDTLIFNKSNNLYSLNFAKFSKNREFILVEGYIDVIALYQIGIDNVVASLGTAFNDNHAKVLKKYVNKAIILFDSDDAGINATKRAIPVLVKSGINCRILSVTDAKDPDEYINKFGAEKFKRLIPTAKSYISFEIEQKLKEYNIEEITQKIEFTKEVAKIIAKLDSAIERDAFIKEACLITQISFEAISQEVKNIYSNSSINFNKIKYNKPKNNLRIDKVEDAKKGILSIISSNLSVFNSLREILKPYEFLDNDYIELAEIIYEKNQKNQNIYPVDIVNKFENSDVQKKISKVFMQKFDFSESEYLEKVINDYLKIVKKEYTNFQIEKCTVSGDLITLQKLIEEKKQIDEIYIRL